MANLTGKETRELSDIIHLAYSDALVPSMWREVLSFLKKRMSADAGIVLMFYPKNGKPMRHVALDMSPDLFEQYRTNFADREPHIAKAISKGQRVWRPTDVVTKEAWERSEIYNGLLAPHGLHQFAGAALMQDGKPIVRLHFARDDAKRPFSRSEIRILGLLQPHLEQAYCKSRLLNAALGARGTLETGLDCAPNPVLIFGCDGRLVYMNKRAAEHFPGPRDLCNTALAQVQCTVMGMVRNQQHGDGRIAEPMATACMIAGRKYAVRVYPVKMPSGCLHYVTDMEQIARRLHNALHEALTEQELSSCEIEVGVMLIGGLSDQEMSDRLQIPECEVEACIESIMAKLDASDRSKVATKLLGL